MQINAIEVSCYLNHFTFSGYNCIHGRTLNPRLNIENTNFYHMFKEPLKYQTCSLFTIIGRKWSGLWQDSNLHCPSPLRWMGSNQVLVYLYHMTIAFIYQRVHVLLFDCLKTFVLRIYLKGRVRYIRNLLLPSTLILIYFKVKFKSCSFLLNQKGSRYQAAL